MRLLLCGLFLVAVAGCNSGPDRPRLSGSVTLDGEALAEGNLMLESSDGINANEMAIIQNGKYEIKLAPGERLVRITAARLVPGKKDDLGMPVIEQIIPDKYNKESTITITISSNMVKDFDLKSK